MKQRSVLLALLLALVLLCTACAPQSDKEPSTVPPEVTDPAAPNTAGEPKLTPLSGDGALSAADFPLPTAEVYGLTGIQASLYNTASALYNTTGPNALSFVGADDFDLMLPRFTLLGSYTDDHGLTTYILLMNNLWYWNLGHYGVDGDEFFSTGGSSYAISITLNEQGDCVGYLREFAETPVDAFYDTLCGPRTDLADYLKGKTDTLPEEAVSFPLPQAEGEFLHADKLLLPYLRAHFSNTDEWIAAQPEVFQDALRNV